MQALAAWLFCALALILPGAGSAAPLIDLPQYPQIDNAALERHAQRTWARQEAQARAAGQLGCVRYCEMLARVFARIVTAVREEGEEARAVQWRLSVVTTPGEAALSLPGGQIVISEHLITTLSLSEAEVAFILAHEVAHVLLKHEAEVLDYVQATITPHGLRRTVWDLYAELDYSAAALLRVEGLMQRGELEADFAGLLLGAQAGYAPGAMAGALTKMAAGEPRRSAMVQTHPAMALRLEQQARLLPVAERLLEVAGRP